MALQDYAASDEQDYYGQNFERSGVVSVWVGISDPADDPEELDVLQDRCGVGYYDLDSQEGNAAEALVPVAELLAELSYAESFLQAALAAATKAGVEQARWVLVQYDFAYDPQRVKRTVHDEPRFLGVFAYSTED